jgi:hypothetical protein
VPVMRVVAEAEDGFGVRVAVVEVVVQGDVHRARVGPVDADVDDAVARGDFGGEDFLQGGVQAGVEEGEGFAAGGAGEGCVEAGFGEQRLISHGALCDQTAVDVLGV